MYLSHLHSKNQRVTTRHRTPFRLVHSVRSRTPHMPQRASASVPSAPLCFLPARKDQTKRSPMPPLLSGIGCSFGFGRSMPSASSSLASFIISYACAYFVHNLYTKTKTATNHVSNLHPRCLYAGIQNTAKKLRRYTSPLQPP